MSRWNNSSDMPNCPSLVVGHAAFSYADKLMKELIHAIGTPNVGHPITVARELLYLDTQKAYHQYTPNNYIQIIQ